MKILIAEDDVVSRRVLVGHLERWGYEVTETADGPAAWAAWQDGDFPIAILDWMMPGMDGVEVARRIRETRRATYTYLILLTAKAQKQDLVAGIEAGADDYVTKPFDREELRVRVLAGRRLVELQTALTRAEKSASVGQVALGLAQELFEPTNRVRDNLMLLRREALDVVDQLQTLRQTQPPVAPPADLPADSTADTTGQTMSAMFSRTIDLMVRMQDIIRNLRDFAHADQFFVKPVDVRAALRDVAGMVDRLAESKAVEVHLDLPELPQVSANAGKLKKVVLHLLVNAIDAVDIRGAVWLAADHDAGHVTIRVRDNGRGIAAAHLPHIFEPFHSLRHPADRGMGLGLAISDAIIREHGGTLDVESVMGNGSTFTIRLPALPPEVTISPAVIAASPAASVEV